MNTFLTLTLTLIGGYSKAQVKMNTFENIMIDAGLDKGQKIDFVSIDIEGAEMAVLKSIDFDRFDISSFVIENNQMTDTACEFLESKVGEHRTLTLTLTLTLNLSLDLSLTLGL